MANKDVFYFSHDANALSDPKILAMRCDFGFEGYGLYFAILEMLRNESTYKLPLQKNTYRAIKIQTGTTLDVEKFINACINEYKENETGNGLFNTDGKTFWSESFLRRMEKYEELKEKRTQAANARWNRNRSEDKEKNKNNGKKQANAKQKQCKCIKGYCKSNANAHRYVCKCNASLCKLNQIKSKEIKLNKIKLKSIYPSDHIPNENENDFLDNMMDETDKIEFENIVLKSKVSLYEGRLCDEVVGVMKEIFMNPKTRNKILNIELTNIDYALKNFAIANTKQRIQKPKAYFKQCLISALEQTELSKQIDANSICDNWNDEGG